MSPTFRFMRAFSQNRRSLRALETIASAQVEQTAYLKRLADWFAPLRQETPEADLRSTGISYSRDLEQAKILDFVDQTYRATGREPTEEEVVTYLDGKPAGSGG